MTTATKMRGIGFRDELIGPIMRDMKTQTRRVINPQPNEFIQWEGIQTPYRYKSLPDMPGANLKDIIRNPHGKPGDRLYVKEAIVLRVEDGAWLYRCDSLPIGMGVDDPDLMQQACDWQSKWLKGPRLPFRSARFMPRWAARTFIEP